MSDLPTGRRGQFFALALLLIAVSLIYIFMVGPLLDLFAERSFEVQRQTERLRHLRAAVQELPALRAAQEAAGTQDATADVLLDGSTDSVAAAALQTTVKLLLSDRGGTLNSVEILAAAPEDRYRRITIHTSMTADLDLLVDFLKRLETIRPRIFVDNLEIRAAAGAGQDTKLFSVSLDLYGYRS